MWSWGGLPGVRKGRRWWHHDSYQLHSHHSPRAESRHSNRRSAVPKPSQPRRAHGSRSRWPAPAGSTTSHASHRPVSNRPPRQPAPVRIAVVTMVQPCTRCRGPPPAESRLAGSGPRTGGGPRKGGRRAPARPGSLPRPRDHLQAAGHGAHVALKGTQPEVIRAI